jgi:ATP-dependent RNA helicase RhlE
VLIATDIAARGIDVKGISLVVNFDLPEEPEAYVHRIGRTARAGRDGMAVAFCDDSERSLLRQIERLIRMPIPVLKGHPFEGMERKPVDERGHLGDGIDRPRRPSGPRHGGGRGGRTSFHSRGRR